MFDLSLLLAYPIDQEAEEDLASVNPFMRELLTSGDLYLEEVEFEGQSYLGKYAPNPSNLQELENLETNVSTLLERLLPNTSIQKDALSLVPHDR